MLDRLKHVKLYFPMIGKCLVFRSVFALMACIACDYLLQWLRQSGGAMRIELKDGLTIHVENGKELAEVLEVLAKTGPKKSPEKSATTVDDLMANETERVRAFFQNVNPNARKFMALLLAHSNGIKGERFAELSGFKVNTFGGIMGGIEKIATSQKLKRIQFIASTQKIQGAARFRWLAPGKLLIKYEIELRKIMSEEVESQIVSVGA